MLNRARAYIKDHPTEALVVIGTLAAGVLGAFYAGDRFGKLSHERNCAENVAGNLSASRLIDDAVAYGSVNMIGRKTGNKYKLSAEAR